MTPQEKMQKLKDAEARFFEKLTKLTGEYRAGIKEIVSDIEKRKLSKLKEDLGLHI